MGRTDGVHGFVERGGHRVFATAACRHHDIQRLDVGTGFEGGLAVVILAVLLDRITQSFGQKRPSLLPGLRALFARNTTDGEAKQGNAAARLASH